MRLFCRAQQVSSSMARDKISVLFDKRQNLTEVVEVASKIGHGDRASKKLSWDAQVAHWATIHALRRGGQNSVKARLERSKRPCGKSPLAVSHGHLYSVWAVALCDIGC